MRRTSHEVRGLKSDVVVMGWRFDLSHLTRGAWIEIVKNSPALHKTQSRTSHEVRGLKSDEVLTAAIKSLVAPHTRCVD